MSTTERYAKAALAETVTRRPHNVYPSVSSARVVLAIKNFSKVPGVCHIGLGVTAMCTMKVLRRNGVRVEAWSAQTAQELEALIAADAHKVCAGHAVPVTHVIVSAPSWIQPNDFGTLAFKYPEIEFVQLNHSGCAYLSIDKFGIKNIREVIDLANGHPQRAGGWQQSTVHNVGQ